MSPGRPVAALAAALLLGSLLNACGGEDYCAAVKEHQTELSDVTAAGSPSALLEALPIFRDLEEQAPEDIRDDWHTFLDALGELDGALRDAGVDPSSYDRKQIPEGVSAEERVRIEAAAAGLTVPEVVQAFDSVQQQAKDVCHTPLSL